MLEIVGTFLGSKHWDKRADCAVESPNSPRGNLAQERLEFAVRQLDGIEVGRVLRQATDRWPRPRHPPPNAGPLVGFEIVHDDDVIAPEITSRPVTSRSRRNRTRLRVAIANLIL